MTKIKKINIFSYANLQAIIMAYVGLLAGILYSFGGLIIDFLVSTSIINSAETPGLSYGTVLAFGALIGMPALFAAFGYITGLIGAVMYNLFSSWFGGLEINLGK